MITEIHSFGTPCSALLFLDINISTCSLRGDLVASLQIQLISLMIEPLTMAASTTQVKYVNV